MVPSFVTLIPLYIIYRQIGWIDTHYPLWVPRVLHYVFAIFLLRQFFMQIPQELEDAARIDGATTFQIYWRIMLPQVAPALATIGIFAFLRGWEEYVFVRTLLLQKANWTMSLYLFWMREDVMGTDYAMVSAMGVFYVLPSVLLYTFTQKYLTQMTIGGIKG